MYHFVQYLYHFIFILFVTTLVVPCLDNIFMVLLISELAKIGATKLIFLDSVSPRVRGRGLCMRGHGLLLLYSSYPKFKYSSFLQGKQCS